MTPAAAGPPLKALASSLEQAYPVEQKDQTFMVAAQAFSLSINRAAATTSNGWRRSFRDGGHRLAGRLPEPGKHAPRPRRTPKTRSVSLGGSRWQSCTITHQRLRAGGGRRRLVALGLWCGPLVASLGRNCRSIYVPKAADLPVLAATFGFCLLGTFVALGRR